VPGYFAHIYLLVFGKIAVGGLLSLAIPPFAGMERGFYKSSAAVYLGAALATAIGELVLAAGDRSFAPTTLEVGLWLVFAAAFAAYWISLYLEQPLLRARSYPAALLSGGIALAASAWGLAPAATFLGGALPAAWALAGAAVTGAGASGMLLGHWYLIDTGLDLEPLWKMTRFYRTALVAEFVVVAVCLLTAFFWPGGPWDEGFAALGSTSLTLWLVGGRIAAWGLAALLGALIARTLAIPQTMAATGLFYIAALVVAVGEIIAHWVVFRTGIFL
jgi:hypothetical protein